jgi:hypothetical protein
VFGIPFTAAFGRTGLGAFEGHSRSGDRASGTYTVALDCGAGRDLTVSVEGSRASGAAADCYDCADDEADEVMSIIQLDSHPAGGISCDQSN